MTRIAGTECPIEGCQTERATLDGYCEKHRARLRRNGTTEQLKPWTRRDPAALCDVPGCENLGTHRGRCGKHEARVRRHGDPEIVLPPVPLPHSRQAIVSYSGVHRRLTIDRGPARAHPCHDCGETAAHWSYDHADPEELIGPEGAYSLDPAHYLARCVSCHKLHDLKLKKP